MRSVTSGRPWTLSGSQRIDHGVNCLEDDALVARLARDGIGLTVCPVSNRFVTDGLKDAELKTMLDRSLRATVNSDDPAYFAAYVNENLAAVAQAADLSEAELARLARNSFEIAWISPAERAGYLADLDAYVRQQPPASPGQVTQNSLPSGSYSVTELPRTSSVRQASEAPA